jgi:hypothetical protein
MDFLNGAELSEGGRTILRCRAEIEGLANVRLSIKEFPNQLTLRNRLTWW